MTPLLEVEGLYVSFGAHDAVADISLQVRERCVVALLGLNGAGKSVTARAIAGSLPLRRGRVHLCGHEVTSLSPEARVAAGLRLLPQVGGFVPDLSVAENLRLGGYAVRRRRDGRYRQLLADVLERFPVLGQRSAMPAGALSSGQQRMLALAGALMADPRVLIADEPSAGLAPDAIRRLAEVLGGLGERGVGVLLVEQNVGLARALGDEVVVLDRGTVAYRESAAGLDEHRLAALLGLGPAPGP